MNFSPKKDEELGVYGVLPAGTYTFVVVKAVDKTSKAGNEMIEMEIVVSSTEGTKSKVYDYLLEVLAWKLKHFCQSTGLSKQYETGMLTADMCKGAEGVCVLAVQKKDESGNYHDKNVIKDYVVADIKNEDLPF